MHARNFFTTALRYVALLLVALVTIGPFLWLLSTALKGGGENIFAYPPQLLPAAPTLGNFEEVWKAVIDPDRVAPCMPGATVTGVEGDSFKGTVKVKLGPISLLYKGSGEFVEKVRAAAAKMDKPMGTQVGGYGVKFDDKFQNSRGLPVLVQWQGGKTYTIYPKEAQVPGTTLKKVPNK